MTAMKKKKSGTKIFIRYLGTYMGILLVPFILVGVIYNITYETLQDNAIESNIAVLRQITGVMDQKVIETQSVVNQIIVDGQVKSMINKTNFYSKDTHHKLINLIDELHDHSNTNKLILDYFILFNKSKMVIGPNQAYRYDYFFSNVLKPGAVENQEDFEASITKTYYLKRYIPGEMYELNSRQVDSIALLHSIGSKEQVDAQVLLILDNQQIIELFQGLNLIEERNGSAMIVDSHGEIISENNPLQVSLEEVTFKEGDGYEYISFQGEEMIICYSSSNLNGWRYVSVLPISSVFEEVINIGYLIIALGAITLLVGIVLAYWLASRNTLPVKRILESIDEVIEDESTDGFALIQNGLSKMKLDNEELQYQIQQQLPLLKNSFINKLLSGRFVSLEEAIIQMSHARISIQGDRFAICILNVGANEANISRTMLDELSYRKGMVQEVLEDIDDRSFISVDLDEKSFALLCIGDSEESSSFSDNISAIIDRISRSLSDKHYTQMAFFVGKTYDNLLALSRSYDEARQIMNAHEWGRNDKVVWYTSFNSDQNEYYYTHEMEKTLINLTKAGRHSEVKKIIAEIVEQNFVQRSLSNVMTRMLYYELWGTVVKIIRQLGYQQDMNDYQNILKMISKEDPFNNVDLDIDNISNAYEEICELVNLKKKSHNILLISEIIECISKEYMNQNLSISYMADVFGLSEVYFSHYFKEQTGQNFSKYLEHTRMEKAKELLSGTDMNIEDIGLAIGYNSINTFGRAFRRHNNISASVYRNSNR